jgi:hypothetical protein
MDNACREAVRVAAVQDALRLLIPDLLEDGRVITIATDGLSADKHNILMVVSIPVYPYDSLEHKSWMLAGGAPEVTEQFTGISPTFYHQHAQPLEAVCEELCEEFQGVVVGYAARSFLVKFLQRICLDVSNGSLVDLQSLVSGRDAIEVLAGAAKSGMTLGKWYDLLKKAGGWRGSLEASFGLFPGLEFEQPRPGEPVALSLARNTKRLFRRLVIGGADDHVASHPGQ